MNKDLYINMAAVEDRHWWFQGRRKIVETMLRRLPLPAEARILDLGCGTGGNLKMLAQLGKVDGCEMDANALQIAGERGVCHIHQGYLPDHVPFPPQSFDVVVMTDVLEHVEDHEGAVGRVATLLKPGGYFIATVPALPWLWSDRDTAHHHFRRYKKRPLRELLVRHGLTLNMISYYNLWFLPLVALMRLWSRWRNKPYKDDLKVPGRWLNGLLRGIFTSERHLLGRIPLPLGVSLIAVAQLPVGATEPATTHAKAQSA